MAEADPKLKEMFLEAFKRVGNVKAAAEDAGVSRHSHYYWMANDDEYRAKYRALRYTICQRIEDSLIDRLANGWEEPVFQGGEEVGVKRKFDNSAAIAYLDRHDKDFIAGKKQNVDVTSNGESLSLGAKVVDLARTDPEYLEFQRQKMLAEAEDAE